MEFDAVLLSRFQFAWVVAFHILLPAFTVGLSCFIATLELQLVDHASAMSIGGFRRSG